MFDHAFEGLVVLARALLHAHDHVAIHLDETAVAIPGETFVFSGIGQGQDGLVVEAEI